VHKKHFSAATLQQTSGVNVVISLLGLTWQNTINAEKTKNGINDSVTVE
jgi:hypothetical protein